MTTDPEVAQLQQTVQALTQRLYQLEWRVYGQPPPAAPPQTTMPAPAPAPRHQPFPAVDLTPSRILAVAGGLVLLLGTGFLLRYVVAQGWLTPGVRVLLALLGSGLLAGWGVRLEQRDATRTVGQICTATATAGAYAAVVAAAIGYHLIPEAAGLAGAAVVAGAAAVRGAWTRSQGVAGLGIGGALAAPLLVQATGAGTTLGFLVVALAAGLTVAVRCGWPAVTGLALALVSPQVWLVAEKSANVTVVLTLAAVMGLMFLAASTIHAGGRAWPRAVGPGLIAVLNAGSTALLGHLVLSEQFATSNLPAATWVAALAAAHLTAGIAVSRRSFGPAIGIVLTATAVLLTDAAILVATDGYAVAATFAAVAVAVAIGSSRPWLRMPSVVALSAHLGVVALHGLAVDVSAPPAGSAEALLLVAAMAGVAALLGVLCRPAALPLAVAAAATYLAMGLIRLLAVEAPLSSLLHGTSHLGAALLMCVVLTAGGLLLAQLLDRRFTVAAVTVANYALSLAAVSLDPDGAGRVALTGLWAVGGGVALVAGRRLKRRDVRRGGAALLAAAVTKAALVDTVLLDGTHRATALLLCGTVLVCTAVAEARAAGDRGGDVRAEAP